MQRLLHKYHLTFWGLFITLFGIFTNIKQSESHSWKGQKIVLFVTYDLSGEHIKVTLGLPYELLTSEQTLPILSPTSRLEYQHNKVKKDSSVPPLFRQLSLKYLSNSVLSELHKRVEQDLQIIATPQLTSRDSNNTTSSLKKEIKLKTVIDKIDLILHYPDRKENESKRYTRKWRNTEIETHSGQQNALVISFRYKGIKLKEVSKLQVRWLSKTWFLKTRNKRIKQNNKSLQSLSSKEAPGLLIDPHEITPLSFTPIEPEVIWRASPNQQYFDHLKSTTKADLKTKEQKQSQKQSWWTKFKGWFTQQNTQQSNNYKQQEINTFIHLQKSIYLAFEEEQDERIYSALSRVLSAELLDQVFQSTYRALILKDQGGARAKVTHVIPLKATILSKQKLPKKVASVLPQIDSTHTKIILYRWRLVGEVKHWGHTHRRVNDYEAIYVMKKIILTEENSSDWRITFAYPLQQKRRPELEGSL